MTRQARDAARLRRPGSYRGQLHAGARTVLAAIVPGALNGRGRHLGEVLEDGLIEFAEAPSRLFIMCTDPIGRPSRAVSWAASQSRRTSAGVDPPEGTSTYGAISSAGSRIGRPAERIMAPTCERSNT